MKDPATARKIQTNVALNLTSQRFLNVQYVYDVQYLLKFFEVLKQSHLELRICLLR